ncbi:hypothetical protein Noc_1612 [Nitrosococcus oceani ATCC 19707]|uniref:Uncharacterized protein n=2 Tax=Nitrosococcus oceani TaxID=1229 RepID=Q3JAQ9_NITOC|nr:hypothetical protein [Nitrosococcus oceani]ABA58087.1 hypothetical protein Noc_1612 [Nitrosococcus oceani ATCC 19707]EDZ68449.1 hypothetical protein NOC27_1776 [Nitrosococcus oceani AFC27]KFI19416.1 hypothetical protein IB75_08540 [Nitrosococcus oceani C-27]GEM21256.1 hypothetical protein NONS58_26900 [Nitrosococcus oceani]
MSRVRVYLLVLIFFGFALSAAAGENFEKQRSPALENSALFPLLEGLLREKSGLPLNSKQHSSPAKEAMLKSESVASRLEPAPPPEVIVEGIIVRFQSPDIQALAQANLPPPEAVIAELEAALGEELVFHGAMVNEAHVFRFLTPKESRAVTPLLQRAENLPSIEWIEADTRVEPQSSSNDPFFSSQWNLMGEKEGFAGGIEAALYGKPGRLRLS